MSSSNLDLNAILAGAHAVLVEDVEPADSDISDAYTGLDGAGALLLRAEIHPVSASPTITITVEQSIDGDSWATLDTFDAIAADGVRYLKTGAPDDQIRLSYAVSGGTAKVKVEICAASLSSGGGSLPDGGTTGQALVKESDTDGDAGWEDVGGTQGLASVLGTSNDASGANIIGVGDLAMSGLPGATAETRFVGATASGAPASGTFAVGDYVIDQTGLIWVCTTLGTPGTWKAVVGATITQTLINKRITKRTGTVASSATPTINTDNVDFFSVTALATAITSMTSGLTGTPTNAQTLWLSFLDDGTARGITWGASFEASTVALPTTTVISTRLDVGFVWNAATSKWRCVAVA